MMLKRLQFIDDEIYEPIGLLMREHKLIEHIVKILENELIKIKKIGDVDTNLVLTGVDFF